MSDQFTPIFQAVRTASRTLATLTDQQRSQAILALASLIESEQAQLLEANASDLARMDPSNPLYDRLQLTPARLAGIASDLRHVAELPTPVGEEIESRTLPNGILLRKVRSPFGVIGVVYEARPNVTFDVFALCIKSGNACILKGGRDADDSNRAAIALIHRALTSCDISANCALLLPSTHEATAAMLGAIGYVDVCIPRGGRRLIDFVRSNARVPVIETGAGVVHTYFDANADMNIGRDIIDNAKTRRVSVCNALDSLLVHSSRLADLPTLLAPLAQKGVELHVDAAAMDALRGNYPASLLIEATDADKDREWMDMKMGVYTVSSIDEAIAHIDAHGSGHSESIITESDEAASRFTACIDAACVYVNLPTSFTDGAQFGLGAEIGISTQKLGPRGPMGLREITTYRYILSGHGQIRKP
ncbi:MAG: glutamate-5-semialdehyde dehydrogenase [Muribaculaceae bacterium]|nr:glutamate-5-semialdehyde dehydrogenase [Muribaculaceae bacterium]